MSDPDLSFAASRKGSGQSGHPFQSIRPPIPEISEKVAGLNWNQWPDSIGIDGRISPEYAPAFICVHLRQKFFCFSGCFIDGGPFFILTGWAQLLFEPISIKEYTAREKSAFYGKTAFSSVKKKTIKKG